MNFRNKTYEELLDLEQELLHNDVHDEKDGYYYHLVSLYEEMHRVLNCLTRDNREKDKDHIRYIERKLVFYLIQYGSYLKMSNYKDERLTEQCLNKALRYDRENPIAHYRLGFLAYKNKDFTEAISHFQKAIQFQKNYNDAKYTLNKQQNYFAHLYLSNSALNIAKQVQTLVESLEDEVDKKVVPNLSLSPLYELIRDNETYLKHHEFTVTTPDGKRMCTEGECMEIINHSKLDTIILYFTDYENSLRFNGKKQNLESDYAEMLRYFLLYSKEDAPVTKDKLFDIFQNSSVNGEIVDNTYSQKVRRLRTRLLERGIPPTVIVNKRSNNQTGYYFSHSVPFIIIHRSDASFILE